MKNKKRKLLTNQENIRKAINIIKNDKLAFFDFIIILNDKLLNYKYNMHQIFSYVWTRYNTNKKRKMWIKYETKDIIISGKTYFTLLLCEYNFTAIKEYLNNNFGLRGNDLTNIIIDLSNIVRSTAEQVLNKSF